jgi:hypothetical protein
MAYADLTYYRSTFYGRPCPDDAELTRLLSKASDDIDLYTNFAFTFSELSLSMQEFIKKSTCAQAENYVINGDGLDSCNSLSLGSFSISGGTTSQIGSLCDNALKYLSHTGLTYRGLKCKQYHVSH